MHVSWRSSGTVEPVSINFQVDCHQKKINACTGGQFKLSILNGVNCACVNFD